MLFKTPRQYHYFFSCFLIIYVVLGMINLDSLPIAWTDEVQNLAPSVYLHKTNYFASPLWPNPGAENHFFSYLPLSIIIHYPWLKLVGISVFKARLLYFIIGFISLIMLYVFMAQNLKAKALYASFFTLVFALDKCNFEIMRSMRSEVIEVFLILVLLFLLHNGKRTFNKYFYTGITLGLIAITHLKLWPVIPVVLIWLLRKDFKLKTILLLVTPTLVFGLIWIAAGNFDFKSLYEQLWLQGSKHSASHSFKDLLYGNLIGRFNIYFPEQVFMPLIHLCSLILIVKNYKKLSISQILYLVLFFSWFILLQPHHRYLPVLNLLAIVICCSYAGKLTVSLALQKWAFTLLILISSVPFLSRHLIAIVQHRERNPEAFEQFLSQHIPAGENTLITGNSLAFYYAAKNPGMDYMIDFYPQHYQFKTYKQVYYVTTDSLPLKTLGTYQPEQKGWLQPLKSKIPKGKAVTYYGNKIYRISTQEEWNRLFEQYMKY